MTETIPTYNETPTDAALVTDQQPEYVLVPTKEWTTLVEAAQQVCQSPSPVSTELVDALRSAGKAFDDACAEFDGESVDRIVAKLTGALQAD